MPRTKKEKKNDEHRTLCLLQCKSVSSNNVNPIFIKALKFYWQVGEEYVPC